MLTIHTSDERGDANHGWLRSKHSFSFGSYHNPERMGFGPLRVINEDRVAPGQGFGAHGHRDMEIISYVLDGQLAHKDSMGTGSTLSYGDVQRMSAGSGVQHSEFNGSERAPVHFLQIWIQPSSTGAAPGYQEERFEPESKKGQLRLIISADGREGSISIRQNASVYAALLDGSDSVSLPLSPHRLGYAHLIRGEASVNGRPLKAGDSAELVGESSLRVDQARDAEILVFDLPESLILPI